MEERIRARGHEHVTARHGSTLEVTTDEWLTPAGDCIVGVGADRGPAEFDSRFVDACRTDDVGIHIELTAGPHRETIAAKGSRDLTFGSDRSAVVRTSEYVDDRTVAIDAGAAACDLDRDLIAALADGTELAVTIRVDPFGQV